METNEQYHADYEYVSHSMLEVYRQWVPTYYGRFVSREIPPPESTPAMALGTLLHCLVLEPECESERFAVATKCDRRTSAGKAAWAEFAASANGKTIVDADTYSQAVAMRDAIAASEAASRFLSRPQVREQSIRWTDKLSGLKCKCRPDVLFGNAGLVVDIKTSSDPTNWARQAGRLGYHRQAAWYIDGVAEATNMYLTDIEFVHLVVGTSAPYPVILYMLGAESLSVGRKENEEDAESLAGRLIDNDWTDQRQYGIQHVEIPRWALNH